MASHYWAIMVFWGWNLTIGRQEGKTACGRRFIVGSNYRGNYIDAYPIGVNAIALARGAGDTSCGHCRRTNIFRAAPEFA